MWHMGRRTFGGDSGCRIIGLPSSGGIGGAALARAILGRREHFGQIPSVPVPHIVGPNKLDIGTPAAWVGNRALLADHHRLARELAAHHRYARRTFESQFGGELIVGNVLHLAIRDATAQLAQKSIESAAEIIGHRAGHPRMISVFWTSIDRTGTCGLWRFVVHFAYPFECSSKSPSRPRFG